MLRNGAQEPEHGDVCGESLAVSPTEVQRGENLALDLPPSRRVPRSHNLSPSTAAICWFREREIQPATVLGLAQAHAIQTEQPHPKREPAEEARCQYQQEDSELPGNWRGTGGELWAKFPACSGDQGKVPL